MSTKTDKLLSVLKLQPVVPVLVIDDLATAVPLARALVLLPIPETAETRTALVTLRPPDAAQRVPDVLYSDYREPIAAGARAWVRRNYGDWVNPQFEAEDRAIFERAVHNQNIRRAHGGAGTALRVRTHPF